MQESFPPGLKTEFSKMIYQWVSIFSTSTFLCVYLLQTIHRACLYYLVVLSERNSVLYSLLLTMFSHCEQLVWSEKPCKCFCFICLTFGSITWFWFNDAGYQALLKLRMREINNGRNFNRRSWNMNVGPFWWIIIILIIDFIFIAPFIQEMQHNVLYNKAEWTWNRPKRTFRYNFIKEKVKTEHIEGIIGQCQQNYKLWNH